MNCIEWIVWMYHIELNWCVFKCIVQTRYADMLDDACDDEKRHFWVCIDIYTVLEKIFFKGGPQIFEGGPH